MEANSEHGEPIRDSGLFKQRHACLDRCSTAFPSIAMVASDHDILPGGYAALGARYYVIDGRFAGNEGAAAILALVLVTGEEVYAGEWRLPFSELDIPEQTNDGRDLYDERYRANFPLVNIDNFYFSEKK